MSKQGSLINAEWLLAANEDIFNRIDQLGGR
jgi:hypothetical protein